jgi:hypothetical protein
MRWDEWRFSASLAWRDAFVRHGIVFSFLLVGGMTTYMLWRLIPEGLRSGVLAVHYTMYLGIDDVRDWPWVLVLPGGMLATLLANVSFAVGVYRYDSVAARTLTAVSCALAVSWAVGCFFLVRINL